MKKLLLYTFLVLSSHLVPAQQLYFTNPPNIPLRDMSGLLQQNAWTGGINFPLWSSIDINGDGILDLYMYDKSNDRVSTFINDGSAGIHAFHYAPEYISRFPAVRTDAWALCYDYNCDGKEDFMALDSAHSGIEVWRNDYTIPTGLRFTKVSSELMEDYSGPAPINIYATTIYVPAFADFDNDGDMDILGFNNPANGKFAYHKNLSMDLYGHCDSLEFVFEDKCWGNFTLSIGSNTVSTFHDPPCGTPIPPDPKAGGMEIAKRDDTITTVYAIDLDGNGPKELLIGDQASPTSLMVHNGGTLTAAEMDTDDATFPSYDASINIYDFVHHAYIDADNDGKRDLLASSGQFEDRQGVWFYKNTNTDASPVFSFQKSDFIQNEMLETGQGACPVFFDADADGLLDIVVAHGEYYASVPGVVSRLSLYKNTGTSTTPEFQLVTHDYASISSYNLFFPIAATFGDLDGDNDKDMIIGDFVGNVHMFNNSAGAGNPANFALAAPMYMGIDAGNNATPQLVDMDYDGLLDLVIGKQTATFNYYHNNGSAASASFTATPTIDTLGNIMLAQVGFFNGFSVPYVFTFSGRHQMLTANMHGDIYYYDNIDNNLNGTFNRVDTVASGEFGMRSSGFNIYVSGGDINNDGYVDMIVGLYTGGVRIYYGTNIPISVNENTPSALFTVYPNPGGDVVHLGGLNAGVKTVTMYNMLGEAVYSFDPATADENLSIDISAFPAGMYIVSAAAGEEVHRVKLVVRR